MTQKKQRTKSSAGKRRSHDALKTKALNECSKCGKAVQPHHACPFCGTYRSAEVVKTKTTPKKK